MIRGRYHQVFLMIKGRETAKQQVIQDIVKYGASALLATATGPSGTGFFRKFIYANLSFASTAAYNAIRMMSRRSNYGTTRRRRYKYRSKYHFIRNKKKYYRRKIRSKKTITRVIQEYDGSVGNPQTLGFVNSYYPLGGVYIFNEFIAKWRSIYAF